MEAQLIGSKLRVGGYIYVSSKVDHDRKYWDCVRTRRQECTVRAVTRVGASGLVLLRGPSESPHTHAPNVDAAEAEGDARSGMPTCKNDS